jgi:hypothetical protein
MNCALISQDKNCNNCNYKKICNIRNKELFVFFELGFDAGFSMGKPLFEPKPEDYQQSKKKIFKNYFISLVGELYET